jgi:hypothetical protein
MPQPGNRDRVLKKALEGIVEILGPSGEQAIISELRSKCDYGQEYLSLKIVRETLVQMFGPNSTDLLLEQVTKVETRYQARLAELKHFRR